MRAPVWKPTSEAALCEPIVAHYERAGWTVYQEVATRWEKRADIVIKKEDDVRVIEAKTSFTEGLLYQGQGWLTRARLVYVAVPVRVKPERAGKLGYLGLIRVTGPSPDDVHEVVAPKPDPLADPKRIAAFADKLGPHLVGRGVAGTSWSNYLTPYRRTCELLRAVVDARGEAGILCSEAVKEIDHHYATTRGASSTLAMAAWRQQVPGVYVRLIDGRNHLFPERRDFSKRPRVYQRPEAVA